MPPPLISFIIGRLLPVVNLTLMTSNSTFFLTWEPPFTLDIANIPDITGYCVEVLNLFIHTEVIYSECDINVTEFSYFLPPDAGCNIYVFRVAAVNIVGMGEAATTPPYYRPLDTGIIIIMQCMDVVINLFYFYSS